MALNILKYIPVPAFLARENSLEIIDVNSHAEVLMEMTKAQLLGRTMQDFIPDSYLSERGTIESIPLRINKNIEIRGNVTVKKAPDTNNIIIYTFVKDDIDAEHIMFSDLMKGVSLGILVVNKNLTLVDVNPAICEIIETPRSELIGKSGLILAQKFLSIDNVKRVVPAMKNMLLGKSVPEYEIEFRGKTLGISSSIKTGSKYYVAVVRDITKLRKQKVMLRDSEELYRNLFHSSKDAIFTMNPPYWNIKTSNRSALELFGLNHNNGLAGTPPWALSPQYQPDGSLSEHSAILRIEETKRYGYSFFDWQHQKMNGTSFSATVLLTLVETAKGSFIQATVRDVSKQRELEYDLISAKNKAEESDRLKSAFLANMSHEIRTPMNGILGFTELLKRPDLTHEQIQKFIEIIRKSGRRMLETVNDLIEISKIETGQVSIKKDIMNISDQMNKLIQIHKADAEEKSIELVYKAQLSEDIYIETDISKFNTIMTNLVKNAIKFTNEGTVSFGYKIFELNDERIIEFFVDDTGIGIPKNKLTNIFRSFEQIDTKRDRNYEGSGLGLSISQAYAEMLKAEITITSEVNLGSRFSFKTSYVPISLL